MREKDFQKRITDMATRFGWKWWHVPAPMRWSPRDRRFVPAPEAAGISDLLLTHHDPPRLVFMEVKGDGGKLSDGQREFLQAVKTVAEAAANDTATVWHDRSGELDGGAQPLIGVMAVWPKDEAAVEQMLRTKVVT